MKQDANTSKLIKELLELPTEARAAVAASLIGSLDEAMDSDSETAWEAEIGTRIRELDSDKVKTIPWSEVRRILVSN